MRLHHFVLLAACMFAGTAVASPTDPRNGIEYTTLAAPQPVAAAGKKVEVIEFFMYHCPHCYSFEPDLASWVKKQGDKIIFRRIHVPYTPTNDPEAHLFLTFEALGKSDAMLPKVFKAFHVDHLRLTQDAAIIDWASRNGFDRAQFLNTWGSFVVMTRLRRLPQVTDSYNVRTTPTVVIDGKYVTSPAMGQTSIHATTQPQVFEATLQIMDALVAKAAAAK
jgi:thiol:disulfide interchange protein DsbA